MNLNITGGSEGVVVSVGVISWKWVVLIFRNGKWNHNAPSVAEGVIMLHLGHSENGNCSHTVAQPERSGFILHDRLP